MSRQILRSALHAIVRRNVRLHADTDPDDGYRVAWRKLTTKRLATFLAQNYRHRHQPNPRELLTILLIAEMTRVHPRFSPPQRHRRMPQEFSPGRAHRSALIVGIHAGYGSAYAALSDLGHRVSLLKDAQQMLLYPNWGRDRHPTLELIPNDRLSLAHISRALKAERLVCCAVDYRDPQTKTYSLISPAIFELARRTATPLYFAKNTVSDDGTIEIAIDGPFPVVDAVRSAQDMIDYINAGRCQPKSLQLRAPSGDASPESESSSAPITPPAATPPATTAPPAQSR